jgi:hypothetical protein
MILEKIEKADLNRLLDNSREISSLALRSKGSKNSEDFVSYVEELCENNDKLDQHVARAYFNQLFEDLNRQNMRNLQSRGEEIKFIAHEPGALP